jgi:hypothetical protein
MSTTEHLLRHFAYAHLPQSLQSISRPFHDLAHELCNSLKAGPERHAALRKLVESKDCAVRAAIDGGALSGFDAPRPPSSGLAAGDLADRLELGVQGAGVDPATGHRLPPGSPYSAAHVPVDKHRVAPELPVIEEGNEARCFWEPGRPGTLGSWSEWECFDEEHWNVEHAEVRFARSTPVPYPASVLIATETGDLIAIDDHENVVGISR